ncbi:MAG TPA: hypothetical protein VLH09_13295 [Bryobacteraceae bacterium]|nr:hypothetical protein [Bryobacteraceae bacterium]
MKHSRFLVLAGWLAAGAAWAQPSTAQAPIAASAKIEIKGKIERIRIGRGQGMPSLDVRTGEKTVSVTLGPMRYLLEQDFNPKAGEEVAVTGYKLDDGIVAITVPLPAANRVRRLRDDAGRPAWMGGRRGGRSTQ